METYFAPAQRTERRKLKNQLLDISQSAVMDTLLNTAAGILVLLNEDRQIVGLNHSFLESLGIQDASEVLGLRLGESLSCIHAYKEPAGCGTTEYCSSCGAAIAMMAAIQDNAESEQICALVSDQEGTISDLCLQVRAKPIMVDNKRWILFYAQDVTQQQFWLNMDRVFFHDVNNTLTALYGNVQLMELENPECREIENVRLNVERLMNEIAVQKDLSNQKDATSYVAAKSPVSLSQVRRELEDLASGHKAAEGKELVSEWPADDMIFDTDPLLLSRILGNMVINALEATPRGGLVRITAAHEPDQALTWSVWNQGEIPAQIQKRIFQRYFSSKSGDGRGLGTYSMKLFGETYLKGKISFRSTTSQGTHFRFTLPI